MGTKVHRGSVVIVAGMIAIACGKAAETTLPKASPKIAEIRSNALLQELRSIPREAEAEAARPRVAIGSLSAPAAMSTPTPVSAREAASAALSPDARTVVTLRAPSDDETGATWKIVLWDLETGAEQRTVALAADETPLGVAFRKDGARLAVTLDGAGTLLIAASDGKILGRIGSEYADTPLTAVFTPDGGRVAVSMHAGVELWDAETVTRIASARTPSPFNESIPACGPENAGSTGGSCARVENEARGFISPGGSFFAQLSGGEVQSGMVSLRLRQVQLYASADLAPRCPFSLDEFADLSPDAFTPDDRLIAIVSNSVEGADPFVVIRDTETCQPSTAAASGQGPVVLQARFVVVSPATPIALVVGDAYTAELWKTTSIDPPKVELMQVLDTARATLSGAAFSRDGRRVALFDFDGQLQVFEAKSGERLSLTKVGDTGHHIRRATFLSDGKRVLVSISGGGSQAALVDVDQGKVVRRFE